MKTFSLSADVVVLGAGSAGAVAAMAAADTGKSVLVVEQFGSAGGSSTLALVTPMMHIAVKNNPMCSYLSEEINHRLLENGAAVRDGKSFFDPLMLSFVLEEMLAEKGVQMLYHTTLTGAVVENGHLKEVEVHNKSGRGTITANLAFVDATGDCDAVALAGLPFMRGSEEEHVNQPCSLRYTVGGVDTDKFWKMLSDITRPGEKRPDQYEGAVTTSKKWPLTPVFEEAIKNGDATVEDMTYWQFFTIPGRKNSIAFNCPEFFDVPDVTDAMALSRVQVEGKKAILRQLRFYKKYLAGFEDAYVEQVSAMVGIREGRRAVTEYVMTAEDALAWRKFDDAIARTNYPVDVHGRVLRNDAIKKDPNDPRPYYEIPLRALMVKDVDNLLVAGRCLGSEFVAQASARVIPTCRAMGEAAGIAAAMNTRDGKLVREEMIRRGAQFS